MADAAFFKAMKPGAILIAHVWPHKQLATVKTLAAQRASKILGIFARLDMRDGKPQYLRHQPRIWTYLSRSLAHPALSAFREWYAANVPPPVP